MNILKDRYIYLWISGLLFVVSLFLLIFTELNLGIDMTGGVQMEYNYTNSLDINKVSDELDKKKNLFLDNWKQIINSINVYPITWEKSIWVIVWFYNNDDEIKLDKLKNTFKAQVYDTFLTQDKTVVETKYVNIWKSFGDYIKKTAYITLILAIIAITFYITFAFSWVVSGVSVLSFATITIITLLHDIVIASWAYILTWMFLPEFQIDIFFITALLTILWYSINDTIVVFDRIRSNLKKYAWKPWKHWKNLEEIINMSVNETMTRSIYTSMTLVFVLFTIFIFWPETISWFILVMIFGTVFGTYSSIFIASPILFEVNKKNKLLEYKEVIINPEDKIVV